jgi:hypothetical protein
MAARIDIPLRRNEDWGRVFVLRRQDGQPYDLTGCTGQFHVRSRTNNAALVAAGTLDFSDAAYGRIEAILRASEGNPLNTYGSALQTENLPFDIRVVLPSGLRRDLVAGAVILSRGVSHD